MIKISKKNMELIKESTINLFEVPVIGNYRLNEENNLIIQKFVDFIKAKLCTNNKELQMTLFPHRISGDNYISIEIKNSENAEINFLLHIRGDKQGPYWPEDNSWESMRIPFSIGDSIDTLFFLDEISKRLGIKIN